MLLLDAALRISAATMLLITAIIALRDARHLLQGKLAAALCVSLAAMLINTMPAEMDLPIAIKRIVQILHLPNVMFLWLFGLSLFEDDFKLKPVHWGVLIASPAILLIMQFTHDLGWSRALNATIIASRILQFGVLIHLLWTAISGRKDDLVENRRRTRLWFILGVSVSALLVITAETSHYAISGLNYDPDWLSTLRTAMIWPMIFFGTIWFLNMRPEHLLFEPAAKQDLRKPSIDPKDATTYKRLKEVMEAGQAFTEQGLTIGALAEKIAVPEHQLRALINQGLGFRNFAAFLNSYRISYAKKKLSDPEQARLPILTIAMDAGYNSLAPFNRAFKALEGITPSEFRLKTIATPDQS